MQFTNIFSSMSPWTDKIRPLPFAGLGLRLIRDEMENLRGR